MQIILAGLPGKMASEVANGAEAQLFHRYALGSRRHRNSEWKSLKGDTFEILSADELSSTLASNKKYVALDFSPNALEHIKLWEALQMPAVIGATAFDLTTARTYVAQTKSLVVLAPNLAAPIVALQAILRLAADKYPSVFTGLSWSATESHQAAKKDVSGTARALLPTFKRLGFADADVEHITSIRDPKMQRELGVPEEFLAGHGWHRYEASKDGVTLALEHRTNGRGMYVAGAVQACEFAIKRWEDGQRGVAYDMMDVVTAQ